MAVEALYYRILRAVWTEVKALPLTGLPPTQVLLRKVLSGQDATLPAVIVAPWPQEKLGDGTTETWWTEYPTIIGIVSAGNQILPLSEPELMWREVILERFRDRQELTGVSGVFLTKVEPRAVVDTTIFKESNLVVSSVLLWWVVEQPRQRG